MRGQGGREEEEDAKRREESRGEICFISPSSKGDMALTLNSNFEINNHITLTLRSLLHCGVHLPYLTLYLCSALLGV